MFDTKKNYLYILHSVIPLFCGLFIYLTIKEVTIKEDTFISYALSSLRSIMPVIDYPVKIRNFVADYLWTYSLFFCLRLTLGDDLCGKYNIIVLLLTAVVAVVIEGLQGRTLSVKTWRKIFFFPGECGKRNP